MNNQVLYIDRFIKEAVSQEPAFLELAESTGLLELEGGGFLELEESGDGTLFREVNYLDLDDRTKIATTYKGVSVGQLTNRFISRTNRFSLPITDRNRRLLGYPDKSKSTSDTPYLANNFVYEFAGLELMRGPGIFTVERDRIQITIYESQRDFYDEIESLTLNDIDTTDINPNFADGGDPNLDNWKAYLDGIRDEPFDNGVVAPVIDYGKFFEDAPTFDDPNELSEFYLPGVYYGYLINKIISEAGYTGIGKVLQSDRFKAQFLAYSRSGWEYSESFTRRGDFLGFRDTDQVIVCDTTTEIKYITLPVVLNNGDLTDWNGADGWEQPALDYEFVRKINVELFFDLESTGTPAGTSTFRIGFHETGSAQVVGPTYVDFSNFTNERVFVTSEIGHRRTVFFVRLAVERTSGTGVGTFTIKNVTAQIVGQSTIRRRTTVNMAGIFPDMSQKEFLKDFLIRFGLITKEKNNRLIFIYLEDVLQGRDKAKDWTGKRLKQTDDIEFQTEEYGQNNRMIYSAIDGVNELYASGNFDVDNNTLDKEATFYQTPYNNTFDVSRGTVYMASIPVYDDSVEFDQFDNDPGMRVLSVRPRRGGEKPVIYDTVERVNYKVANFVRPQEAFTMLFSEYLQEFYPTFINSLQQEKRIKRIYYLDTIDFHNFVSVEDEIFLIFDDGEYFLVEEIRNYLPGQPVEVSLFKVT